MELAAAWPSPGTAWVSLYLDGDPTQLAPGGSIVQTLPRSEPPPAHGYPTARIAGTQDPSSVLVVEATLDARRPGEIELPNGYSE